MRVMGRVYISRMTLGHNTDSQADRYEAEIVYVITVGVSKTNRTMFRHDMKRYNIF